MNVSTKFTALFLVCIIVLLAPQALAIWDVDSEEGLIGYWNFNLPEEGGAIFFSNLEAYRDGPAPSDWSVFSGSPVISSERAFSGNRSIKLEDTGTSVSLGLRTPKVPVEEGLPYTATSRYFNEAGASTVYFEFWDDSNKRIEYITFTCSTVNEWDEAKLAYVAPSGAKYASLLVYSNTKNVGTSYHDDLKIVGASIARDISGNDRHGVLYNNTHWMDGRFGTALKFDGDADYMEIPYDAGLKSPDAMSFEAWIYPTPPHQKGGTGGIVNNLNGAANSRILIGKIDGVIRIRAELHGYREPVYGPEITNEAWNHIVYIYDGTQEVLYVNGEPGEVLPYTKSMPTGTSPITLGWGHTGDNYHYNGLIDEVKIYNRALSPEEIVFKASNPPKWKGIVCYPNPTSLSDVVKVACFIDKGCQVELTIYNENGSQIVRLKETVDSGGYHEIEWDGKDKNGDVAPAGIYFAVVNAIEDGKTRPLAKGALVRVP